jgi:hypothetical protein
MIAEGFLVGTKDLKWVYDVELKHRASIEATKMHHAEPEHAAAGVPARVSGWVVGNGGGRPRIPVEQARGRRRVPSVPRSCEAGLDPETLSLRASLEFISREFARSGA